VAMAKISKSGKGKVLFLELSIYPCGSADPTKNLTISCPDKDTQFKTTLSDYGLKKFRTNILEFYKKHILYQKQTF
jgi:hypothetical protein